MSLNVQTITNTATVSVTIPATSTGTAQVEGTGCGKAGSATNGGGAGAYAKKTTTVTPSAAVVCQIGKTGAGTSGLDTSFGVGPLMLAKGGGASAGGAAASCVGDVVASGGAGGTSNATFGGGGGAAGSASGTGAAGGNAAAAPGAGGVGVNGAGSGGLGANTNTTTDAVAGTTPGGGGGGSDTGVAQAAGAAGTGKLIVSCPLADLTIGSPTVGSDGHTITVPITGVVGALSPALAVTGFSLKINGSTATISAATSSGSTVTLTSAVKFWKNDVLSVSLATNPTSNLTDAAAGGGSWPSATSNSAIAVDLSAAPVNTAASAKVNPGLVTVRTFNTSTIVVHDVASYVDASEWPRVLFDTAIVDTCNGFDPANPGVITAPAWATHVRLTAHVEFSAYTPGTAGSIGSTHLFRNGQPTTGTNDLILHNYAPIATNTTEGGLAMTTTSPLMPILIAQEQWTVAVLQNTGLDQTLHLGNCWLSCEFWALPVVRGRGVQLSSGAVLQGAR